MDAMLKHTHDAPAAAIKQLNTALQPTMHLIQSPEGAPAPTAPEGMITLTAAVRGESTALGSLHLVMPRDEEESAARHFLSQLAHLLGKLMQLQDRHNQLQKLAITDELTGLYNARYFKHFLTRILDKARAKRFPVTLLLFDIDNFKKYNDTYGHGVGDEILKQTAMLMKRCCRDHDLVARISGDEFAVVFWEKEGPRQPRQPGATTSSGRLPSSLVPILERFRRLVSSHEFTELGASGRGTLTISGGLAVFPYDAHNMESLIQAADHALMFGAKHQGKNCINLVGEDPGTGLGASSEPIA
jgi:GGDEF domain-containing protein